MTPEQVAQQITQGVEREYVKGLLDYVLKNFDYLNETPDPQLFYRVQRLYDIMAPEMVDMYLSDQRAIIGQVEALVSEAALDAGNERALQVATGHTPGLMYAAGYQALHDVTVKGCVEIINRQNVALAHGMADKWYQVSIKAVTELVTWQKSKTEIIQEAVAGMRGITDITYESGARYPIESAVRRHIETQLNQNHQRLNDMRAAEYGWELFMCSAHEDSRPSHYDFQGKVFSKGPYIGEYVDGEMVYDYEELGVESVEGIYGANCRHYLTVYIPGASQVQRTPYDEEMNEERYDLTQKQRARERRLRADKLELYQAKALGDPDVIAQAQLRVRKQQASIREFCKENDLIRRYDLEKAYPL